MIRSGITVLLFFLACFPLVFSQEDSLGHNFEHITKFSSDIILTKERKIRITETISVISEQDRIKHGIYREIPLSYETGVGKTHYGFEVLEVKCDGKMTEYRIEKARNGKIIYIGSEYRRVKTGAHVYQISYELTGGLYLGPKHDEFYWNINGNGWQFSIDTITALVHLPKGAKIKGYDGFTGGYGYTNKDFKVTEGYEKLIFETTVIMSQNENLTVSVLVEKGGFIYPNWFERFGTFLETYIVAFLGVCGIFIGLFFNLFNWFRYGRDPKEGTIIPLFYPPQELSPGECAYLKNSARETSVIFGATLMSLAIKGMIKIETKKIEGLNVYFIHKHKESFDQAKKPVLEMEMLLFNCIFNSGKNLLVIKEGYHNAMVYRAKNIMIEKMDEKFENNYYTRNEHIKTRQNILPLFTLIAGFTAYWFYGGMFALVIISCVIQFGVNYIFSKLIETPTKEGRKIMDNIAGYEMYLNYAEKDKIEALNPPTLNFNHFEDHLAYAIAFDLVPQWSKKFNSKEIASGLETGNYSLGVHRSFTYAGFTTFCNGFSSAISAASVAPSIGGSGGGGSFGGGGGGFSGGGGGGGGGGGW